MKVTNQTNTWLSFIKTEATTAAATKMMTLHHNHQIDKDKDSRRPHMWAKTATMDLQGEEAHSDEDREGSLISDSQKSQKRKIK